MYYILKNTHSTFDPEEDYLYGVIRIRKTENASSIWTDDLGSLTTKCLKKLDARYTLEDLSHLGGNTDVHTVIAESFTFEGLRIQHPELFI